MTPKERMLKALHGETPDVLPAAPCYLSLFLADFERAGYIEQYRRALKGRARLQIDHDQDTEMRALALYQSYGIFKQPPDWIEVSPGASRAWAERTAIVVLGDALYYEDQESGERLPMDSIPMITGEASLSEMGEPLRGVWDTSDKIQSRGDVDAQVPLLSAAQWLGRGDFDLPRRVAAEYGDRYFIHTILDTPYSEAYSSLGFQELMLIQHDRPELLHYLLQRRLAQHKEIITAWATTGVHGVFVEEIFSGADMISQDSYDKFVFAYNRPYFQHMRSAGLLPIHYVCGDAIPRVERMLQYDLVAVALEESKKNFHIEIEELVERVAGRAAVFGNIDAVRFGLHARPEEMAGEVVRQARTGAGGRGFIAGTGSPFPLDTNPRNIDALVVAAHSLPG